MTNLFLGIAILLIGPLVWNFCDKKNLLPWVNKITALCVGGLVALHILPEAFEVIGWWSAAAGLAGFVIFYLIEYLWFLPYYYSPVVILNGYAGFEVQLPDTLAMRIPEKVSSSLTPDIDNNVRRDLGDQLLAGFGARYKAFDFTHFQAAYGFRYKGRDSYEGDSYADFRYNWIGRESEQRMHTMQLGVTFSTVDLYKQKRFAAPAEITLAYTSIVSGKNVTKDPLTTLELALFF